MPEYSNFSLKLLLDTARKEFGSWFGLLTLVSYFLMTALSILYAIYVLFEPPLLPIFNTSLIAFRAAWHFALDVFVFSWLRPLLASIWYLLLWIVALVFPVTPIWCEISIPQWYKDLLLLSIALPKIFERTEEVLPFSVRDNADKITTKEEKKLMWATEGWFWGRLHRPVEYANLIIWHIANKISFCVLVTSRCVFRIENVAVFLRDAIFILVRSIFMGGIIRFIGYAINVIKCWNLHLPLLEVRKVFFGSFLVLLLSASMAVFIFIIANGYALDYLPKPR